MLDLVEVAAYHSPSPSARTEDLEDATSLLLPAAAEANEEGSVDGMLNCVCVGGPSKVQSVDWLGGVLAVER